MRKLNSFGKDNLILALALATVMADLSDGLFLKFQHHFT